MDFLKKNARTVVIALLAAGVIVAVATTGNNNNENKNKEDTPQTVVDENAKDNNDSDKEKTESTAENTNKVDKSTDDKGNRTDSEVKTDDSEFTTVARQGDNQTVLVRDVITKYLSAQDTELSAEQKLYIETNLVNSLSRDNSINPGYVVKLSKSVIEEKVSAAKALTQAELNRWKKYL